MGMVEIEDNVETKKVIGTIRDVMDEIVATFRRIGISPDELAPSWRGEEKKVFSSNMEEFAEKAAAVKRMVEPLLEGAEQYLKLVGQSSDCFNSAKGF